MNGSRATQRVNAAVHLAIARILETKTDVQDRHALGQSIGRRLQGTYGAALRQMVDSDPDASSEGLVAVVIAPTEFPWDDAAAQLRQSIASGARDRARRTQPNAPSPAHDLLDPDWRERLAEVRAKVAETYITRPPAPPLPLRRDVAENLPKLREALDTGRQRGAEARVARRSQANDPIPNAARLTERGVDG